MPVHKYKENEDPTLVIVKKTSTERGPLNKLTWKSDCITNKIPVMCIYKLVRVKCEVWGLQTRVEGLAHRVCVLKNLLLIILLFNFALKIDIKLFICINIYAYYEFIFIKLFEFLAFFYRFYK